MTTHPATPTPTDLPEALRLADICERKGMFAPADELRRLHALSAAAPAVAPANLITIRKPTTPAELAWLAKLAHLLVQDINSTLGDILADAQPQAGAESYPPSGRSPNWTDGTRTLQQDVVSAVRDFSNSSPEDGESWESWFEAAFDLLGSRVTEVFEEHAIHSTVALRARGAVPSEVIIDFDKVGTAGPFPIVDGRVKLPEVTMADLAYRLRAAAPMSAQAPSGLTAVVMPLISRACDEHVDYHALRVKNWTDGKALSARNRYRATLDQIEALLAAAPHPPAALPGEQDAARLDFIGNNRVALIPEFEGGWDAQVYEEDAEPSVIAGGMTVRGAIDAAMAAAKDQQ